MSQDNRLKTAAGLSELWDGKSMRRVRAGDGASVLPGRRLSLHLMAQPEVADILLGNNLLAEQGLLSRMLVTAPDSIVGSRLWRDEDERTESDLKRYGARLLNILERPLPLAGGKSNELMPRALPLALEARNCLTRFHDHVEKEMRPGGGLEQVRGLANKLPEHAARLAGVLSLVADIERPAVGIAEMQAGIEIAEHYAAEALRLAEAGRVSGEVRLAKRLLGWLHDKWSKPVISLPDIYQLGPGEIRELATAKRMVAILVEHGWLEEIEGGAVVAGVRRRGAWRIVRES
jgi:hypothetical protein